MTEPGSLQPKSGRALLWVVLVVLLALCLLGGGCAAVLVLTSRGDLFQRNETRRIPSPDGTKVLVTSVNRSQVDPTTYLTVQFEIRDAVTDAVLFQQGTGASDRMRWSMNWLSDDEIKLVSSDIGDYCWRESSAGSWASAPCSR
jgi:hypothetical protein